jgi:hypothetical protein
MLNFDEFSILKICTFDKFAEYKFSQLERLREHIHKILARPQYTNGRFHRSVQQIFVIQHCLPCRPSDSSVLEDAFILLNQQLFTITDRGTVNRTIIFLQMSFDKGSLITFIELYIRQILINYLSLRLKYSLVSGMLREIGFKYAGCPL